MENFQCLCARRSTQLCTQRLSQPTTEISQHLTRSTAASYRHSPSLAAFSLKSLPLRASLWDNSRSAGGRLPPAFVHNVLYLFPSPSKITSIPRTFFFCLERLDRLPGLPLPLIPPCEQSRAWPGLGRSRRACNRIVLVGRSCSVHNPKIIDLKPLVPVAFSPWFFSPCINLRSTCSTLVSFFHPAVDVAVFVFLKFHWEHPSIPNVSPRKPPATTTISNWICFMES